MHVSSTNYILVTNHCVFGMRYALQDNAGLSPCDLCGLSCRLACLAVIALCPASLCEMSSLIIKKNLFICTLP